MHGTLTDHPLRCVVYLVLSLSNMFDNVRYHKPISLWIRLNTFENKRIQNTIYVFLPVFQPSCTTSLQRMLSWRACDSLLEQMSFQWTLLFSVRWKRHIKWSRGTLRTATRRALLVDSIRRKLTPQDRSRSCNALQVRGRHMQNVS